MYKMLITLSILLFMAACTKKTRNKLKEIVILSDHSDTMPIYPTIDWFIPLKNWEEVQNSKVTFEIINDLPFHNKSHVSLTLKSGLFSNDLDNRKQLKTFYEKTQQILDAQNRTNKTSPKSVIFPILADHLNKGVIEVHLFSDLIENSFTKLNRFQTADEILKHKDKLILEYSKIPIQKGSAKIYIYYSAKDYEQGLCFQAIVNLYKALLEPKGYKIKMGSYRQVATENTMSI
ncbi:MAG: hypothetical protein ACPGSD_17425 [Flavobacteriales bacterium]